MNTRLPFIKTGDGVAADMALTAREMSFKLCVLASSFVHDS